MMIEELTKEQEALMEIVAKQYEDNVFSGDTSYNIDEIRKGLKFLYGLIDLPLPRIEICASPYEMKKKSNISKNESIDKLGCGYDSGWVAFYDYFQRIGIAYEPDFHFNEFRDYILKSGIFSSILFENIAYVCLRPSTVYRNASGDLHNPDNMAISWPDGLGEYALNGVFVPEYLVMTPAESLDINFFKKEKNADVKTEFIKKFGLIRMIKMGKVVDSYKNYNDLNQYWIKSEYELINMSSIHEGMSYAPYLKMKNLTTGDYHLEGVGEHCKTIKEALEDCYEENLDGFDTIEIK